MTNPDIRALDARFDEMPASLQVIVQNQPSESIDERAIYCRWVVDLGASNRAEQGPTANVLQLGTITLQIIAPEGTLQGDAYEVRRQFVTLFRDWRSADAAITMLGLTDTKREVRTTREEAGYLQLNVQFAWRSYRPANA